MDTFNIAVNHGVNNTLTNGNTMTATNSVVIYGWDAADRLVKITNGTNVIEFVYDCLSRRVAEKLNGAVIKRSHMKTLNPRKKEGFSGQKAIVIPRKILINQCHKNGIINSLYITDIGYYPKAQFHYRERPHGADQHILIY